MPGVLRAAPAPPGVAPLADHHDRRAARQAHAPRRQPSPPSALTATAGRPAALGRDLHGALEGAAHRAGRPGAGALDPRHQRRGAADGQRRRRRAGRGEARGAHRPGRRRGGPQRGAHQEPGAAALAPQHHRPADPVDGQAHVLHRSAGEHDPGRAPGARRAPARGGDDRAPRHPGDHRVAAGVERDPRCAGAAAGQHPGRAPLRARGVARVADCDPAGAGRRPGRGAHARPRAPARRRPRRRPGRSRPRRRGRRPTPETTRRRAPAPRRARRSPARELRAASRIAGDASSPAPDRRRAAGEDVRQIQHGRADRHAGPQPADVRVVVARAAVRVVAPRVASAGTPGWCRGCRSRGGTRAPAARTPRSARAVFE